MSKQFVFSEPVSLKHAKFSIKALVRKDDPNLTGLDNYNMVLHERVSHNDYIACKVDGKIKTYLTGLNENVPEVQDLNPEQKEAKIAAIRRLVARAEREIEGNYKVADPDTKEIEKLPDFWANVTIFKSVIPDVFDNQGVRTLTYWDNLSLKLTNDGIIFDEKNIKDLILMNVIEAGGFSMVAKSYEDALNDSRYKFYLDKRQATVTVRNTDRKVRDKAGAKLLALLDKDANKLFYITKLITADSLFFKTGKNATPNETFYEECSRYLDGETSVEPDKALACAKFLEYEAMKIDELKARCVIRDAKALRYLVYKENEIYHLSTSTILGRNNDEAALYLCNPANIKVFDALIKQVEKEWI